MTSLTPEDSGTHQDNSNDRVERGRQARGEKNGFAKLTQEQVVAIRADPRPFYPIARDYGITEAAVGHIKHKLVWAWLEGNVVFGNKRGKLTDDEVRAIRADARSTVEIAREFGIGKNAVWYIRKGLTHQEVV